MTKTTLLLFPLVGMLAACGGTEKKSVGPTPGTTHSSPDKNHSDGDLNDIDDPGHQDGDHVNGTGSDSGSDTTEPASNEPSVTFVIKNSGNSPLTLNMDKGWAGIFLAYSGEVPNAVTMLMFPTHCTASCDADKADRCPYCPTPKRAKDIKAAEKHDDVASGDIREIKWDMSAFDYEKTRGTKNGKKNARCSCYQTVAPKAGVYTVQACGLRKTKDAKKRSEYPCVRVQMTLPVTEATRIELDFE
ncbi:MAG: hypothetical protein JKY56_01750 [Kofleriaceae bacterium]|nr:hypothetical protein [Kofleriaceae bacterium]